MATGAFHASSQVKPNASIFQLTNECAAFIFGKETAHPKPRRLAQGIYLVELDLLSPQQLKKLQHLALDAFAVQASLQGPLSRDADELCEALGASGPQFVALTRGLNPAAKALNNSPPRQQNPREFVLLGRNEAWRLRSLSPWPHDPFNRRVFAQLQQPQISRAELKWAQSHYLFKNHDIAPESVQHWLELGAAPGGMTAKLAEHAQVTALDLALLSPKVANHPRVHFVQANVHQWRPRDTFDGLLCDLNGPPRGAIEAICRMSVNLVPNSLIALTLKLPDWAALEPTLAALRRSLIPQTVHEVDYRHFASHRQFEVAWLGLKRQ